MSDPRRAIPAVDTLLATPEIEALVERAGRARVVELLRAVQGEARANLEGAVGPLDDPAWYARQLSARIEVADVPSLQRVINATGVVLHTNLGRAPLAEAARRAVAEAAGYAALELDLETGQRGSRFEHCVALLRELTGAGDALVVNNNAAAVVLALNTLANGAEAVISRGELVEIGGSFRVAEIMARSGALMAEVGSTNRTHLRDYRQAVGPNTALILKVHRSNFRIEGFTAEVDVGDLAALARDHGIPVVHDLGSGALLDLSDFGLPHEPTAREALAAGADVVSMSGDKLLGGPQAGILLGSTELVGRMRANPLCRALRPDKLTLAALEATLALYRDPREARSAVPVLRMLGASERELTQRAERVAERLRTAGVDASTVAATSAVGGGAYPGVALPTTVIALTTSAAEALARHARHAAPPVVGRIRDGRLLLDLRAVAESEEGALVRVLAEAWERVERNEPGAAVDTPPGSG
jgi:L-seryl-tRNA(Ser) seleniumtransferase